MNKSRKTLMPAVALTLIALGAGCGEAGESNAPVRHETSVPPLDIQHTASGDIATTTTIVADTTAPDVPTTAPVPVPATTTTINVGTTIALPAPPPSAPPARPPLVEGFAAVELIAPGELVSERAPEFSWQPVEGAASYRLVISDANGPVWAWEGAATAIRLGGLTSERPAGFGGPVIGPAAAWSVAALDASGAVLGLSELRPLTTTAA